MTERPVLSAVLVLAALVGLGIAVPGYLLLDWRPGRTDWNQYCFDIYAGAGEAEKCKGCDALRSRLATALYDEAPNPFGRLSPIGINAPLLAFGLTATCEELAAELTSTVELSEEQWKRHREWCRERPQGYGCERTEAKTFDPSDLVFGH